MTELRDRDPGELVQPIILRIDKEDPSSEDEGLSAVARAAVIAYLQDPQNPDWQQWASQAFAKSVRRANPKMFAKVLEMFPEQMVSEVGKAQAVGLPPLPAADLPKLIAKLQVSGTQLPKADEVLDAKINIVLNKSLEMSTGKAAAQAAHALFAWLTEAPAESVEAWLQSHAPVGIRHLPRKDFEQLSRQAAGPVIQDAGRTEIEPGSVTAFVMSKAS
ncbi:MULTISPECIES: peptidyl-tRNA hydrolase [Glutamicibacter]|uniref:peptidyl-tRNA hydrolase n=1 Tax=Glutamicibacter nicotianae TaxID=37929 RepID=A0ABQ0RKI7_GLUNI|nr:MULTISPECIES: peptidyl-tRNA hydrolase [Glutamicibacter]WIV43411.1 peptidyl-tRNA hydrolase [Glutamicibacter nicotianae]GEC12336.1 peptidyl-tRNA hydrolase [Glutamicibacter nicotianae]